VTSAKFWRGKISLIVLGIAASACTTGPQVTRTQALSESADVPYEKILVIALFSSFDSRRYLEDEVVRQLTETGTDAVASTSMMNSQTPVTRPTFLAMVDEIDADAVLVTQLASLRSTGKAKDMNPQATHIFTPTYYYNVWEHELTEYVEPQVYELTHSLILATQAYSVAKKEAVWAIESKSKIVQDFDQSANFSIIENEARAITSRLTRDGLIRRN
jgi:predicted YcjX-like family ATPase